MIFFMMSKANWGKVAFPHFPNEYYKIVKLESSVIELCFWTLLGDFTPF